MIPRFPVYLFDLDGTLLDSAEDITGAIRQVVEPALPPGQAKPTFEYLRGFIGFHLVDCFGDLFPHYTREDMEPLIQQYRQLYPARNHAATRVYPGAREALAGLAGARKSTATTKGTPTTRSVLELFDLAQYFDHIQGTDDFPCKPAPDVLLRALQNLAADPRETLMVGDSPADMEAARAAGVRVCAVTYGYGKRADLEKWQPDYWVSDLRELL